MPRYQPGQSGVASITVRNTGNMARAFAVILEPGSFTNGSFANFSRIAFTTEVIPPGQRREIRFPVPFPTGLADLPADKSGIRVWLARAEDVGPGGVLTAQPLDERNFRGLFELKTLIPAAAPVAPPVAPAAPAPAPPSITGIAFAPREVVRGQTAVGTLVFSNPATAAVSLLATVELVDAAGRVVATPLSRSPLAAPPGAGSTPLSVDTAPLPESSYLARVSLLNPTTGETLASWFSPVSVLKVVPVAAPPVPAAPPPAVAPTPEMIGVPSLTFASTSVTQGERLSGSVSFINRGTVTFPFKVTLIFSNPATPSYWLLYNQPITISGGKPGALDFGYDTSPVSPGSYDVMLTITDEQDRKLFAQDFPGMLTIKAPAVAPPAVPAPPAAPSALRVLFSPSQVTRGQTATGTFSNPSVSYQATVELVDAQGRVVATPLRMVPAGGSTSFTLDTSPLPEGNYLARVSLLGPAGQVVATLDSPVVVLTVLPVAAPPPAVAPAPVTPAAAVPPGEILSLEAPMSTYIGDVPVIMASWRSSVPAYMTASLMQPPDYTSYVSTDSTVVLPSGTQHRGVMITVRPENALGMNKLRVSLVSETGQTLAVQQRDIIVESSPPD